MFSQKKNYCIWKWNFLAPGLKSLIFSQKEAFPIFQEMELFKKTSYILGGIFPSSKNKKKPLRKNFLYFEKWNFLATRLETFSYFRRELANPEKQTKKFVINFIFFVAQESINMNYIKLKVYKKVPKEIVRNMKEQKTSSTNNLMRFALMKSDLLRR